MKLQHIFSSTDNRLQATIDFTLAQIRLFEAILNFDLTKAEQDKSSESELVKRAQRLLTKIHNVK